MMRNRTYQKTTGIFTSREVLVDYVMSLYMHTPFKTKLDIADVCEISWTAVNSIIDGPEGQQWFDTYKQFKHRYIESRVMEFTC